MCTFFWPQLVVLLESHSSTTVTSDSNIEIVEIPKSDSACAQNLIVPEPKYYCWETNHHRICLQSWQWIQNEGKWASKHFGWWWPACRGANYSWVWSSSSEILSTWNTSVPSKETGTRQKSKGAMRSLRCNQEAHCFEKKGLQHWQKQPASLSCTGNSKSSQNGHTEWEEQNRDIWMGSQS